MSHGDGEGVMSNDERLVYMANQIARNFEALGAEVSVRSTAEHLASFWDPRMKARIRELALEGRAALSPTASAALAQLSLSR